LQLKYHRIFVYTGIGRRCLLARLELNYTKYCITKRGIWWITCLHKISDKNKSIYRVWRS